METCEVYAQIAMSQLSKNGKMSLTKTEKTGFGRGKPTQKSERFSQGSMKKLMGYMEKYSRLFRCRFCHWRNHFFHYLPYHFRDATTEILMALWQRSMEPAELILEK